MASLKKAESLFRRRKYPELISTLEPRIFQFRENPRFYFLLGVSCIETGDLAGAQSYLSRAVQLDPEDTDAMLALAVVHWRKREPSDALRCWLEALETDPKSRKAKAGLSLARRVAAPDELEPDERVRLTDRLVPRPIRVSPWITRSLLFAAIVVTVVAVAPILEDAIRSRPRHEPREGIGVLDLSDVRSMTADDAGAVRYVLTEPEIRDTVSTIGRYFNSFRDNMAIREMNRLLHSNASHAVKERIRMLRAYTRRPDFTSFSDNFSYRDVQTEPWLYDGVYIRWSGRIANLKLDDDHITYRFLVGYHTDRVLEGTVDAVQHFAAALDPAVPVEVIARVEVIAKADDVRPEIRIEVTSLRFLAP